MGQFGIGQPVTRFEDGRLLRGGGRYQADVNVPGQAHAVIVRSMHAHARLRDIDATAALKAPGVIAVFTGADLARDNLGTMRMTLPDKASREAMLESGMDQGMEMSYARIEEQTAKGEFS